MRKREKNQNKNHIVQTRPIILLLIALGFLSAVLLVTMLAVGKDASRSNKVSRNTVEEDTLETAQQTSLNGTLLGVVMEIDTDRKQITLYDVEQQANQIFSYTGGTNITDKYGQLIAISQIPIGAMVDASCQAGESKLTDMNISTRAWEYVGVSNLGIDRTKRIMKITTNKYKYTDDIIILDGENSVSVSELVVQDELTIRGYDETIWSITVTRGHGTVRLADYDTLLGAHITIGYEAVQQIAENMVITVREGSFNLLVENGKYSATKNITINRNQETVVFLSDLGPEAAKQGRITFEITPFGADLYIDGELASYANPLELSYGEHNLEVSLGGYTSYEGILKVDTAGKTFHIDLPEATSDEEAIVTETDTETDVNTEDTNDTNDINDTDTEVTDSEDTNDADEDAVIDEKHLVYVQNPIGASVYINGDFMCTSPGSFQKIIGTHVITFIDEGYETMSYTIEITDDNLDTYISMPDLVKK